MGLALQADADVLDRAGEDGVGDAGKGAGGGELGVGQVRGRAAGGVSVAGLDPAAGLVEGAELNRDAGADADERGESALVEGEGALGLVDFGGGIEGGRVLRSCLEADLDNVKGLTWGVLARMIREDV